MALDANGRRLKAILDGFDIPLATVAGVSGISRTYVSRVLSENDPLNGNDQFWLKVEKALGKIVDSRRGQVFEISARPVELVEKVQGLKETKL